MSPRLPSGGRRRLPSPATRSAAFETGEQSVRKLAAWHVALAFCLIGLMALSLLAFWPNYLSNPFARGDARTHLHAAAGASWLVLFLVQVLAVATRRRRLHRALGRASYVVAPWFVVSSVLLAHHRFSQMDAAAFAREAYTLYLPLSAAALFAIAYGLALVHRRDVRLHSRFMICTALLLVDPVVGRVLAFYVVQLAQFWHYQFFTFGVECLVVLALYRTLAGPSAARRTFGGFSVLYVAVLLLWFFAPRTAAWRAFASWFRQLPIGW